MSPLTEITNWRTSTYSANNASCVETGWSHDDVGYRDTKQAAVAYEVRPVLMFGKPAARAFIRAVRNGEFDVTF